MQKPITLIRQEFMKNLVDVVNASHLPFFVMEPIINDLLKSVHDGAMHQAERDSEEYNQYLQERKNEKDHATKQESEQEE